MRMVFIGDSITEAGKFTDSERLGTGYVRVIHDYLLTTYPTNVFEILNKGISGDRIDDLEARWQTDVIDMKPDMVSISIGINEMETISGFISMTSVCHLATRSSIRSPLIPLFRISKTFVG